MRTLASCTFVTSAGAFAIGGIFTTLNTVQSTAGAAASGSTIFGLCAIVVALTVAFAIRAAR